MFRKYLLPLLALVGIVFAVYSVIASTKVVPAAQPVVAPLTDDEARRMMERQLQRNDADVREPPAAREGH